MMQWVTGFILAFFAVSSPSWARERDSYESLSVLRIEKKLAPDLSLPRVGGKEFRLSDHKGKVILLGFFKTF